MKIEEFLSKVAAALDHPDELRLGQALEEIDGWDSLGILSLLDLMEQEGVVVNLDQLREAKTTDDLVTMASSVLL
jgi:acyl carrier protein